MEIVFLSNGQACYLKEKIGNKYVINKIFEYNDEYGYNEVVDNNDILVDVVYTTQPIEKISNNIKELQAKEVAIRDSICELETKKTFLKVEINNLTKTQISNDKFIINRTELMKAKTLVLFVKNRIKPITLNDSDKSFRGLKLVTEISISTGEERSWGYKLYYDYNPFSGDYLCEKYGILIDPTEQDIEDTIRKRVLEFKFSDYTIEQTDDKYLTDELLERKNLLILNKKLSEKIRLEKILVETQESLSKFEDVVSNFDTTDLN
jgi:hypothetical protein